MAFRPVDLDVPALAASSSVAEAAARAAAAAKAVARKSAPSSSSSSSMAPLPPVPLAKKVYEAPGSSANWRRPPEVFSLSARDDELPQLEEVQCEFNSVPRREFEDDCAPPELGSRMDTLPGLNQDEQEEYARIEASFKRFKARAFEVERDVAALLERLNTRIYVPSSVASSECGDLTSMASSEWDTESLGPTEDGLSLLGSRAGSNTGSPIMTPRDDRQGPLSRSIQASRGVGAASSSSWPVQAAIKAVGDPAILMGLAAMSSPGGGLSVATPATLHSAASQQRQLTQEAIWPTGSEAALKPQQMKSQQQLQLDRLNLRERAKPQQQQQLEEGSTTPGGKSPHFGFSMSASLSLGACLREVPPQESSTSPPIFAASSPSAQASAPSDSGGLLATQAGTFEDEELQRWMGWTVIATPEGRLFFHNEGCAASTWEQPPELADVLGEWVEINEEVGGRPTNFWRNDVLQMSLWKDPRSTTNIYQAAMDGNTFFIQLYAEVQGPLDCTDPKGRSALHYACAGGATQSVLLLLQRGVEVDRQDASLATPLIFACRYGYAPVVKVLVDARADVNLVDGSGCAACHEAASFGHLDCLHFLLSAGADVNLVNNEDDRPVDLATKKRHLSCASLLQQYMQNPQWMATIERSASSGRIPSRQTPVAANRPVLASPRVLAEGQSNGRRPPPAPPPKTYSTSAPSPRSSPRRRQAGHEAALRAPAPCAAASGGHASPPPAAPLARGGYPSGVGGPDGGRAIDDRDSVEARGAERDVAKSSSESVGVGILGRFGRWLSSRSRAPIEADLGERNAFRYNYDRRCWELDAG